MGGDLLDISAYIFVVMAELIYPLVIVLYYGIKEGYFREKSKAKYGDDVAENNIDKKIFGNVNFGRIIGMTRLILGKILCGQMINGTENDTGRSETSKSLNPNSIHRDYDANTDNKYGKPYGHGTNNSPHIRNFILKDMASGIILGVISYPISSVILEISARIAIITAGTEFVKNASSGLIKVSPTIDFIGVITAIIINFIVIAPCEELFYRGFLFVGLFKRKKYGAVISALSFTLYHIFPGIVPIPTFLMYFPYYFFFGIYLCFCTAISDGRLTVPIIAHASFNGLLYIIGLLFQIT